MIAEVIINSSANDLNRVFDYDVPSNLDVVVGMRVLVPFGSRKQNEIGYVIGLKENSPYKCRSILRVVEKVFDDKKLSLAKWMSDRYFVNLSETIKLFVPPGTSSNVDAVNEKKEKWISICENADYSLIKNEKQKRIVEFLKDNPEAPLSEVCTFTDTTLSSVKTLEKNHIISIKDTKIFRNPFKSKQIIQSAPFVLNEEQQSALNKIELDVFKKYLLFGVTGSGKTEIYIQLIQKVLEKGQKAIMLVPEISLTPQMTDRFLSRFGSTVAILHSRLSKGERYDEWQKIKNGNASIVIGARSAIFAPVDDIGVIIIDEEHDTSYKSETSPKYDVRDIAFKMGEMYHCPVILGSATPDVRTYYHAQEGEIELLKLTKRISKQGLPEVKIIDMREELKTGNKTPFSRPLYYKLKENMEHKEQSMLFLNRRGYSTFIMCRDCGYVVKCTNCDVSMTYHQTENRLICHYCGKTITPPQICPMCQSAKIRYFGTGTQKVEQELKRYLPGISIVRMDVDTTRTKNAHEELLKHFRDDKMDVLLGTQMIAKGHDFENVTFVGVLAADGLINIGDYKANERAFELLTQVVGRAGRGEKKGCALIQTYSPDEFCIQCAKNQDYEKFYESEIIMREKLNYPPFCDIIIGVICGEDEKETMDASNQFYNLLKNHFQVFKPAPAPITRINKEYRYRVLMKEQLNDEKLLILRNLLSQFDEFKLPVRLGIDINPNNML